MPLRQHNLLKSQPSKPKSQLFWTAVIGDNVLQPGPFDGSQEGPKAKDIDGDEIGTLHAFCEIYFDGTPNEIDAAIAISSTDLLDNATPSDGYGIPKSETTEAVVGQTVKKYGRTTGLTKGRVYAINATVNVGYDSGVARFDGQIVITPGSFSAGGDSGSLVVFDGKRKTMADDRKPIGLLFAGGGRFTIANPIEPVLDTFDVDIDGE